MLECFDFHRFGDAVFHIKSFVSGSQFMGYEQIHFAQVVQSLAFIIAHVIMVSSRVL